ncbi:hypothetical protein, partial [Halorubrum saccharovorum]|uniref:hypothetical protein n=1 Tax=Halorubrum saccharovorum TaxID=2248 RepID=UPI001F1926AC
LGAGDRDAAERRQLLLHLVGAPSGAFAPGEGREVYHADHERVGAEGGLELHLPAGRRLRG